MVQGVGYDCVLWSEQRFKQTAVGIETGREKDRVILVQKRSELLLKRAVNVLRAADKPDRGHAKPLWAHGHFRRVDQIGMICKTQIIVGTQVDNLAPANSDFPALRRCDQTLLLHHAVSFDLRKYSIDMIRKGTCHGRFPLFGCQHTQRAIRFQVLFPIELICHFTQRFAHTPLPTNHVGGIGLLARHSATKSTE